MRAGRFALLLLLMTAGCAARHAASPPLHARLFFVQDSSAPRATPASIKFGTYNVHALDRRSEVAADLARLADVGAWAIQEVRLNESDGTCPASIESILPPGKWYVASVAVNPLAPSRDQHESQVILSRWPITSTEVWDLDCESAKRRVALAATLDTPDGKILFVNADLEPSFFGLAHGSRLGSRSLARKLAAHHARKIIVTGDFNTTGNFWRFASDRDDVAVLCQVMGGAGCDAVNRVTNTFRAGWIRLSLDHLFVRGMACRTWAVDERATGSDHYPLWCELRAAGETASAENNSEGRSAIHRPALVGGSVGGGFQGRRDVAALRRLDDN